MVNFHPAGRLAGRVRRAGLAGLAAVILGGCANGGASPIGETLTGLLPGSQDDAAQAESLPYASLALDTGDRSGLVILGALAGPHTYWPTGQSGMLVLYREGLAATAGLPVDLLQSHYRPLSPDAHSPDVHTPDARSSGGHAPATQGDADSAPASVVQADDARAEDEAAGFVPWRQAAPVEYRVERRWQPRDGLPRQQAARGRLRCDAAQPVELPLGTRDLERCEERLEWDDGSRTRSTLWRDAESRRLWAVQTRPWPGGPRLEWQVARAWW